MAEDRSLKQLLTDTRTDVAGLVEEHVALAKLELKANAVRGGVGAGGLVVGGLLLTLFVVLGLFAAVYGLHEGAGWPLWLSYLVVAGALLVLGLALLGIAVANLRRIQPPRQTIASLKDTVAALRPSDEQPF